jgi:hypothetical protein
MSPGGSAPHSLHHHFPARFSLSIHKRDTSGTLLLTSSWFVTTTTTNTKIIPALTKSAEGVGDSEEDEAATTICKATAVRKRLRHQWCRGSARYWCGLRLRSACGSSSWILCHSVRIARVVRFRAPTPTERRHNEVTGYAGYERAGTHMV